MTIIICNHRYFISGGPERYLFSASDVLSARGHKVVPFSVKYRGNNPSEYESYFVSPVGKEDKVYYHQLKLSWLEKVQKLPRAIYSFESKRRLSHLIRDTGPDIVYLLQVVNTLTPSVIDSAKNAGVPVVARISDFHLMCPAYLFLRDGQICEACRTGLYHAVQYRCLQNSVSVSLVRVVAMYFHKFLWLYNKVDQFVTPSKFMRSKMIEAGFRPERISYVPSFVDIQKISPSYSPGDYILYVGRIEPEKGVSTLIKAFAKLPSKFKLKIAGSLISREAQKLVKLVQDRSLSNISFVGFTSGVELSYLMRNSIFTVAPSICYDNSPMSVYESLAYGKPVIGSRIGSIPEQIDDGIEGLLFEPGNPDDLAEKMAYLLDRPEQVAEMGYRGRLKIEHQYNAERHYENLMAIFKQVGA